jgi:hypothetical protein
MGSSSLSHSIGVLTTAPHIVFPCLRHCSPWDSGPVRVEF